MPLEILTMPRVAGVIKRDVSTSPLRCHLLLAVLCFQGDGKEQVIYLRIKQQEKFPNTAQVKVSTLEGPGQINKPG